MPDLPYCPLIPIPTALLQNRCLPASALRLYLILRAQAGEAGQTPPLTPGQLSALSGLRKTALHTSLRLLLAAGLLAIHPAPDGKVFTFPSEAPPAENPAASVGAPPA